MSCAVKKVLPQASQFFPDSADLFISLLQHPSQTFVFRNNASLATEAPTTQPHSPCSSHRAPNCAVRYGWSAGMCKGVGAGNHPPTPGWVSLGRALVSHCPVIFLRRVPKGPHRTNQHGMPSFTYALLLCPEKILNPSV